MAMVSCGKCNRWQHIPCHDLNDQRSGRPRRNWEDQQFFCTHCRQRALNGGAYGGHPSQGYSSQSQASYGWPQSGHAAQAHKTIGIDPYVQTTDPRYGHRSPVENGSGYSQQHYNANHVGAASYSRSSYPNNGLSFSHYQADPRGGSSRSTLPSVAPSSSWNNGTGYPPTTDPLTGRMQSTHFVPQFAHNGGVYASNRIPSASLYQVSICWTYE